MPQRPQRDADSMSERIHPQSPSISLSSVAFMCGQASRDPCFAWRIVYCLIFALSAHVGMNAQATEKLKPVTTKSGTRPKITEQYTVRASDGLREGTYTRNRGK